MVCYKCGAMLADAGANGNNRSMPPQGMPQGQGGKRVDNLKCPQCGGGGIWAFQSKCQYCGCELYNGSSMDSVAGLASKLEAGIKEKTQNGLTAQVLKTIGFIGMDVEEEREVDMIRNYAIPNNREDILEFLIMAVSNINQDIYLNDNDAASRRGKARACSEAWISKFEQAYQKAVLICGDDDAIKRAEDLYEKKMAQIKKNQKKAKSNTWGPVVISIGLMVLALLIVPVIMAVTYGVQEKKLQQIVYEVQEDIQNGDYDAAYIKANSIKDTSGYSSSSEEKWDNVREGLLEKIREAEEREKGAAMKADIKSE